MKKIKNLLILLSFLLINSCDNSQKDITLKFSHLSEKAEKSIYRNSKSIDYFEYKSEVSNDSIKIVVDKVVPYVPGGYDGKAEVTNDTLYLYYWEKDEVPEDDRFSLETGDRFVYEIKKVNFKTVIFKFVNKSNIKNPLTRHSP